MRTASRIALATLLAATLVGGNAVAQDADTTDRTVARDRDDRPDMGWLGLLGLLGLAGLKRRDTTHYDATRDARTNSAMR